MFQLLYDTQEAIKRPRLRLRQKDKPVVKTDATMKTPELIKAKLIEAKLIVETKTEAKTRNETVPRDPAKTNAMSRDTNNNETAEFAAKLKTGSEPKNKMVSRDHNNTNANAVSGSAANRGAMPRTTPMEKAMHRTTPRGEAMYRTNDFIKGVSCGSSAPKPPGRGKVTTQCNSQLHRYVVGEIEESETDEPSYPSSPKRGRRDGSAPALREQPKRRKCLTTISGAKIPLTI